MACYYPSGQYKVDGELVPRPCGRCIGCRLEYSRQWAVRCAHEAHMHEKNCFLTLTYNNQNLPSDESINKQEFKKFIKDLRRFVYPEKLRYYGCGEYGDRFDRPHYHLCIFGFEFEDKEVIEGWRNRKKNRFSTKSIMPIYQSPGLSSVWKKGFCSIGEVTMESAGYVARYVTKKVTGNLADDHYQEKEAEFALMSRMPGIGKPWIEKYFNDVYPKDYFTLNGVKMRPPRYYDEYLKKVDFDLYEKVKERRRKKAKRDHNIRNAQKGIHRELVTQSLVRRFENE